MNDKRRWWSFFWGYMDLMYIGVYVAATLIKGHIPFYNEYVVAKNAEATFGGTLPLLLGSVGLAFYASVIASGCLLIMGRNWGRYLSYIQAPLRICLASPSFFPFAYLFSKERGIWFSVSLMILSEAVKVISLQREARRTRADKLPGPT